MALDDWRHGVRIKAELRRQYGVGDVSHRLGQKQAAKIDGLTDRQRVLHGYLFALMIKTRRSEHECREILGRIITETALAGTRGGGGVKSIVAGAAPSAPVFRPATTRDTKSCWLSLPPMNH